MTQAWRARVWVLLALGHAALLIASLTLAGRVAHLLAAHATIAAALTATVWCALRAQMAPAEHLLAQLRAVGQGQLVEHIQPEDPQWVPLARELNVMTARVRELLDLRDQDLGRLREEVEHDALTGLSSRNGFMLVLRAQLSGPVAGDAAGTAKADAVVMLRVCDLASINQRQGRDQADEVLRAVASLIKLHVARLRPEQSFAARLNGADFALILAGLEPPRLEQWLSDILAALEALRATLVPNQDRLAQLGVTTFEHREPLGDVLARADAMLRHCEMDRGAMHRCARADSGTVVKVAEWRGVIDDALDQGRVSLRLQPVRRWNGELIHSAAALQLTLPDGRLLDSGTVMPAALHTLRSVDLDLRCVELAVEHIARGEGPVSVSLAWQSVARPSFLSRVVEVLNANRGAAGSLAVELPAEGSARAAEVLQALSESVSPHGVLLGLHALQGAVEVLAELSGAARLSFVKLAPSLCRQLSAGLPGAVGRRLLVRTNVSIATSLGMEVLCAGAVMDEDRSCLRDLGVQGVGGMQEHEVAF